MESVVVSICCLAYNQEKYIRESIEGFLSQKVDFVYEILIHDDASADGTTAILKEYEAKYPDRIRAIYQTENQYSKGISISRTFQFPRARGKYIAICEGDDYWTDPCKLQKQVDFMESHPGYSLCAHGAQVLLNGEFSDCVLDHDTLTLHDIIAEDWGIMTASILFRKDMLEMPGWFGKIKNGDYGLQLLLALKGDFKYLPDKMCIYRKHPGGVSSTLTPLNQAAWIIFLLHEFNKYTSGKYLKDIKAKIKRVYRNQIGFATEYHLRKARVILTVYRALMPIAPFLIRSLRK